MWLPGLGAALALVGYRPWQPRFARIRSRDGVSWSCKRGIDTGWESWRLTGWYRTPWLVVLYLRSPESGLSARRVLVIPHDAVSGDDHRRLRIRLGLLERGQIH